MRMSELALEIQESANQAFQHFVETGETLVCPYDDAMCAEYWNDCFASFTAEYEAHFDRLAETVYAQQLHEDGIYFC